MSNKSNAHKGVRKKTVNPQGMSEDAADQRPDSQLEQKAKKANTK
ncbi:hypothetical protein [Halobacillus sp. BAB-2008]|nr:hypothetical protein [Halobacillus sp. BAB-2008]ELK47020.1 hypothetical protein D479_08636 [Halobacillus sp. BAB-2008]